MKFHKYHGTGNDFILIDNRDGNIRLTSEQVAHLCHRRFGIGADGLMLLEHAPEHDFRMVYYNSDGGESTMCGNGGRCIIAFARFLGMLSNEAHFIAIDGPHKATIHADGLVSLHMKDVEGMQERDGYTILDTGSPHYVSWVTDALEVPVVAEGRRIRNLDVFQPKGINVNFAQVTGENKLFVRTYERGVEDETMSCGTGVVASAIASSRSATGIFALAIDTPGGTLQVSFTKHGAAMATDVVLTGPAVRVFEGEILL